MLPSVSARDCGSELSRIPRNHIRGRTQQVRSRALAKIDEIDQKICRLDALESPQMLRYQELRKAMKSAGETRELPDGYAVRFPSDPTLFVKVAEWITLERLCCSFLVFGLDWSERDGVLLRLTGGPGVKAFLGTQLSQKA